jgi:2-oxoglutarate dehydrogenase E1 component
MPKLLELAPPGVSVAFVGRPERASPAEGYPAAHAAEQGRIIQEALVAGRAQPALPTMAAAGQGKG